MARVESAQNRLEQAAHDLANKDNPTQADCEEYLAIAKKLPVPNFSDLAKIEKERNTPRWQAALRENRERLSISDEEWERILRETT